MDKKTIVMVIIIIILLVLVVLKHDNQEATPPTLVAGVNEYISKDITDRTMSSIYFNQFIDMMLSDPVKAYSLLDNTTKENMDLKDKEDFKEYVKQNQDKLINLTLNNFATSTTGGVKSYHCLASDNTTYIFIPSSVMEYKVRINI